MEKTNPDATRNSYRPQTVNWNQLLVRVARGTSRAEKTEVDVSTRSFTVPVVLPAREYGRAPGLGRPPERARAPPRASCGEFEGILDRAGAAYAIGKSLSSCVHAGGEG
jgi:hypothetical protein